MAKATTKKSKPAAKAKPAAAAKKPAAKKPAAKKPATKKPAAKKAAAKAKIQKAVKSAKKIAKSPMATEVVAATLVAAAAVAGGYWAYSRLLTPDPSKVYVFRGVKGPRGKTTVTTPSPVGIAPFDHGSEHRLAILVTDPQEMLRI